jgi:APA family basic amino acid/polyamine antiporter
VHPKGEEFYQMKLYPLLPIVFITAYSFVAISIALDTPWTALTALIVMGIFMLIYFLSVKRKA